MFSIQGQEFMNITYLSLILSLLFWNTNFEMNKFLGFNWNIITINFNVMHRVDKTKTSFFFFQINK